MARVWQTSAARTSPNRHLAEGMGGVGMTDPSELYGLTSFALQVAATGSALTRAIAQLHSAAAFDATGPLKQAVAANAAQYRGAVQSALIAINATKSPALTTPNMSRLLDANRGLARMAERVSRAPAVQSWRAESAAAAMTLQSSRALSAALMAQPKLAALERVRLGSLISADATFRRSTSAHLGMLTRSYRELVAAAATRPEPTAHLPLGTVYPSTEYFRHVEMLGSVSVVADDENHPATIIDVSLNEASPRVDDVLRQFDISLYRLLAGARAALASRNPDRARHVTTSLRELLMHVLHALAPDQDVKAWAAEPGLVENGRPTRRGRLLYICREIGEGSLADFVQRDVSASLAFMDSLSAGTHVVQSSLTPTQLEAVVVRTESLLLYLLRMHGDGSQPAALS